MSYLEAEIEKTFIGFRATVKFKELMQKYIVKDTHANLSDFIRSAIREKIQRDYPELMRTLFEEDDEK